MKAILEFNLPEENESFEIYSKAIDYYAIMHEFREWLRGEIKYQDRTDLEPIRDKFLELCNEREV